MAEGLLVEWRHAVAGCIAGLTTVVALHPLDVIKTRMQVQDGAGGLLPNYRGTVHCFRTIWSREGLHGLYAGLTPCIIASGVSWSLYFLLYNRSKSSWRAGGVRDQLSPLQHLWSGVEAGVLATLLTNPIWVLKTRFQLQEAPRVVGRDLCSNKYRTLRQAVFTIAREEGVRGFYRGLGPALLMCTNAAIQFAVYEELRRLVLYFQRRSKSSTKSPEKLPSGAAFVIGGMSKAGASLITYPTQVMRSRLQQRFDVGRSLKYTSLRNAFATTLKREGIRGLYKGLVPSVLRVVPQASLMFMVYEKIVQLLTPIKLGELWNHAK